MNTASQSEEIPHKTEQETLLPLLMNLLEILESFPAERSVFDLYVQQYTAKEIGGILCLSITGLLKPIQRGYILN